MNISILLLIYLVGAVVTYAAGKKFARNIALFFGLIGAGVWASYYPMITAGETFTEVYSWIKQLNANFSLYVDGLAYSMLGLSCLLFPIIVLSTKANQFSKANAIYSLALLMVFAMNGTFMANDGFLYYIFWELALIPIFFISLLWGTGSFASRKKAMVKFFVYTFAGSLFMLAALIYLYIKTGAFDWNTLQQASLSTKEANCIFLGFFLAYAIKIPIFPFHTWQANTYEKAPTMGTILLSGIMLKMGLYSIMRWQLPLTKGVEECVLNTVIVLSLIGVIYAALIALRQDNIKRLLAYSSMSHVGLIAAGIYTNTMQGTQGAIIQMLAHGLIVAGLFYIAEMIYERYGTYSIKEMGSIRQQATKFSSFFLILMFASIGLPGTFSFVGEFSLLYALYAKGIWYAILGGTTIILGAYYMMRMFQKAMLGETNEQRTFADVSVRESVVLTVLLALIIGLGVYPLPIYNIISSFVNFS